MKVEINTVEKTITLLDSTSFKDLEEVKKFIGDWENWTIVGQKINIKVVEKDWYPFVPSIPAAPVWPFNQPYYNDPLYGPFKVTCDVNYATGNNAGNAVPTSFLIEKRGPSSKT